MEKDAITISTDDADLSDSDEGVDHGRFLFVILTLIVLVLCTIGTIYAFHAARVRPFITVCENNPRALYGAPCENRQECLDRCVERLMREKE